MAATDPAWIRRFAATTLGFPRWAAAAPGRLALVTNRSGSWQVWAHDVADGGWRQVTDEPVGVEAVHVLPDGRICWWRDATGGERGHALAVDFAVGDPEPLIPDLPDGWPMGVSFAGSRVAIGLENEGIYRVYVADPGAPVRMLYELNGPAGVGRTWPQGVGGLSSDGRLVCLSHTEHGDILHTALRVLDADTGATVADLDDEGRNLDPGVWSPIAGDHRLVVHERARRVRAARDLGPRHRRAPGYRRGPAGRGLPGGLVARRVGAAAPARAPRARTALSAATSAPAR